MIGVATNPEGVDEPFLAGLQVSFPGAWNEASFRWHFQRPFAGRRPDTVAILNDGVPVSGLGLNYRQLVLPDGEIADVAVITAAWTLPRERGRGYLLRLLRTVFPLARERGCRAVLSFMTADNASAVLLRRAGAWSVPTFYLSNPESASGEEGVREDALALGATGASSPEPIRFHYASRDDWRSQFIDRPLPTETNGSGNTLTIVEHTPVADRLLVLIAPPGVAPEALSACARGARRGGRGFFHVTTSAELARASRSHGLAVRTGYLMVQDVATRPELNMPRQTAWRVHSGDRM